MAGISAATLTGAGFAAGTAGQGGAGGTAYTKTQGTMGITVILFTEPEPAGQSTTFGGVAYVQPNGDVSAADAAAVAALLNTIGVSPSFKTWPNTNVQLTGLNLNGAVAAYSITF